jgi:predicted N-acetyltransferase YhbS
MSLLRINQNDQDRIIKVGLREFPTSFTTDLFSIEHRPDQAVADHLQNFLSSDAFKLGTFRDDDELVGTVRFIRQQSPKPLHASDIVFLFVQREYQHQDIGRLLMESTIEKS